eukprot:CAMPEP_0197579536 /NCGR_PEP_ID=MMETSP1326-20131121/3528_1 /TAXON_ID=1155430 /ORGANISM="Genus nov. species nov., Strain RCC2288" /LENGTH=86 /DNA_ID=CAMNT_0043143037 /DNA_START=196 /DNA_END=453 /DNA_ORIENTATION=+
MMRGGRSTRAAAAPATLRTLSAALVYLPFALLLLQAEVAAQAVRGGGDPANNPADNSATRGGGGRDGYVGFPVVTPPLSGGGGAGG